ncbi:MAG: ubiquinol-cytochrome c reductase iron-sulfur subunit [Acidobacteriota bacterium]
MSDARSETAQEGPIPPTRRGVLNVLLAGGLLGWLGTVFYPVLRYLSPLPESARADETTLADKNRKDVLNDGFTIVALGTERVLVLRDSTGHLRATSAKCTHEGCTVRFKADEGIIWCPCHNGRFDLDGRVISGPPPRPLAAFKVSGSLDTKVVVERAEGSPA